jgi:hypothetical protein
MVVRVASLDALGSAHFCSGLRVAVPTLSQNTRKDGAPFFVLNDANRRSLCFTRDDDTYEVPSLFCVERVLGFLEEFILQLQAGLVGLDGAECVAEVADVGLHVGLAEFERGCAAVS